MIHKLKYSLDEAVLPIDFSQGELNNLKEDLELFEQFDPDFMLLDNVEPIEEISQAVNSDMPAKSRPQNNKVLPLILPREITITRRVNGNIETRMESALADIIEERIQTKSLPIALRKRLMYQRAINA